MSYTNWPSPSIAGVPACANSFNLCSLKKFLDVSTLSPAGFIYPKGVPSPGPKYVYPGVLGSASSSYCIASTLNCFGDW